MNELEPIDEEYEFTEGLMISSTNLEGMITYSNKRFSEVSGYSKNESTGQKHSIIRHPDMPKHVFHELWETIKSGKEWTGIIKNLCKDAKYYWVYSHISPILSDEVVTGYTAIHRPASKSEIEETIPHYEEMLKQEKENH